MGFLTILINIITLVVVAALFYMARQLYRTRPDRALSASEAFNLMWIEPSTVTHSYFNDEAFGPIGNFYGYTWDGGVETTNYAE